MKSEARQQRRQAAKDAKKARKKERVALPDYGDLPIPGRGTAIAERIGNFTEEEKKTYKLVENELIEDVAFFEAFYNKGRANWKGSQFEFNKGILEAAAASTEQRLLTEHSFTTDECRFITWALDAILIPYGLSEEVQHAANA